MDGQSSSAIEGKLRRAEMQQYIAEFDLPTVDEALESLVGHPKVCLTINQHFLPILQYHPLAQDGQRSFF